MDQAMLIVSFRTFGSPLEWPKRKAFAIKVQRHVKGGGRDINVLFFVLFTARGGRNIVPKKIKNETSWRDSHILTVRNNDFLLWRSWTFSSTYAEAFRLCAHAVSSVRFWDRDAAASL